MKKFLLLFLLVFLSNAMSAPITPYKVQRKLTDRIEIREYKNLLLAKISIDKNGDSNQLFRSLFEFISGANDRNQPIKMTSPVFKENKNGIMSMSFAMPEGFDPSNLPKPNDKNIKIKHIKDQRLIAITFSGRSSDENFAEYQAILVKTIQSKHIKADLTNPIRAYYNHPWTLPFLKRNEVLFQLNEGKHDESL